MFFLRGGSHVIQFPDIPLPNPEREDLHSEIPKRCCNRSGVSAIGIAIGDEKYDFGRVFSRVTKDLLWRHREDPRVSERASLLPLLAKVVPEKHWSVRGMQKQAQIGICNSFIDTQWASKPLKMCHCQQPCHHHPHLHRACWWRTKVYGMRFTEWLWQTNCHFLWS